MRDRFVNGLIAGAIAGLVMDIIDLIGYVLKIDNVRYLDFAAIIAFGKTASNFGEFIIGLLVALGFQAILGSIFAFLILNIKSKYIYIKGIVFGISVWFIIYSLIIMFKATQFPKADLSDAISHIINTAAYGVVLAFMLLRINDYELIK